MNMNAESYLKRVTAVASLFVSQVGTLRISIHGDPVGWIGKDETVTAGTEANLRLSSPLSLRSGR
jgi:hypothetical protein